MCYSHPKIVLHRRKSGQKGYFQYDASIMWFKLTIFYSNGVKHSKCCCLLIKIFLVHHPLKRMTVTR